MPRQHVEVPADWARWISRLAPEGGPDGATWIATLPRLLQESLDEWGLQVDGPPMTGWTALVVPVARDGEALVLKLVWPHEDAAGEHLALRRWGGDGAVRLVAANPGRGSLLLERADTTDLTGLWDEDAVGVIGGLLARLHVPALPSIRPLSAHLDDQVRKHLRDDVGIPRRYIQQGRSLLAGLRSDPYVDATLLHGDLHFENVLAADREPWLAIDPKPLSGHPAWDIAPVLFNRLEEMGTGASLRWSVRRRIDLIAEALSLDPEEARAWTLLRLILETAADAATGDDEWVGPKITIIKALDD